MSIDATSESEHAAMLEQIVASVFEMMMGLDVRPVDQAWFAPSERLAAAIGLSGDWTGKLILEAQEELACRLAGHFLTMPAPDSIDDDVKDVLAELANMIGGNFKSILPPGATLSLPTVKLTTGDDASMESTGSIHRHAFSTKDGLFWLSRVTETESGPE